MRICLIVLALLGLAAQQPPDESQLPPAEKQIPAGDYCKRSDVTITKNETHAHHCDCTYSCTIDSNGNVIETGGHRSTKCMASCERNGRHCTCHVEEPCVQGGHNALADMDGRVVAVARRPAR